MTSVETKQQYWPCYRRYTKRTGMNETANGFFEALTVMVFTGITWVYYFHLNRLYRDRNLEDQDVFRPMQLAGCIVCSLVCLYVVVSVILKNFGIEV